MSAQGGSSSLWRFVRPHLRSLVVGSVFLLLTNAAEKAIPWLLKVGVDAFTSEDLDVVRHCAWGVMGLALAMIATRTLSRIFIFNVGRRVEYDLRNRLLAQIHRLGVGFVGQMSTGDVMSRATNDLGQVRLLLGFGGLNAVNVVVAYLSALGLMLAISPKLSLWALLPYPLFVYTTRIFARMTFKASQENQRVLGELATRTQEYLSGVRVVRAFNADDQERGRFEGTNQKVVHSAMTLVQLRAMMFPVLVALSSVGTLVVLWVGGRMVNAGELTKGEFLAFFAYLGQLVWPTMAFGWILSIVQRGRASFERVRELLETVPQVQDPVRPARRPRSSTGGASLEVTGLRHAYGDTPVLSDVSLRVPAGKSLAIVGRTGSGKSTLAGLLPRLLPTPAGSVFLDGVDVVELPLAEVRKAVAYAPQEPFLFSTTIGRNIGFSLDDPDSEASRARIVEAARDAAVLDDIEGMPEGFDTIVGERGVQLSGGQKQRIALARALLNEPEVLVLDDPLSAVDAKTEKSILQALDRAAEGRTLVLITHRAAAARHCDEVVVLRGGRIIESGPPGELEVAGGYFAELAESQSLQQELEAL